MVEMLHLDDLIGEYTFTDVLGKLFARIPGWNAVTDSPKELIAILLILCFLAALGQCVFGYRLRKVWGSAAGVILFGAAAASMSYQAGLFEWMDHAEGEETFGIMIAAIIVVVLAAIVGGMLGFFLWIAGACLRAFCFVAVVSLAVGASMGEVTLGLIIGLAAGLIAFILCAAFRKPFLIFYTSLVGGFTAAFLVGLLICIAPKQHFLLPLLGAVLFAIGLLTQLLMNRKQPEQEEMEEEQENKSKETIEETKAVFETETELKQTDEIESAHKESAAAAESADTCPECGAKHKPTAKYCIKCGHKLKAN